jgi:hypothetical protein
MAAMNPTPVAVVRMRFSARVLSMSSQRYFPAIWARLASTTIPATAMPQPPIQPVNFPNALEAHV